VQQQLIDFGLDTEDLELARMRFGDRLSLGDIAEAFGISSEGVRQRLIKIEKRLGVDGWEALKKSYGYVEEEREPDHRADLRGYFKSHRGVIDYFAICDKLGIDPQIAPQPVTEVQACTAFYKRFGIIFFGTYRLCSRCGVPKPLNQYYRAKHNAGGRWTICKACNTLRCHDWCVNNKNKLAASRKVWYKNNKDKAKAAQDRYRAKKLQDRQIT
jgi:hypothetical protein